MLGTSRPLKEDLHQINLCDYLIQLPGVWEGGGERERERERETNCKW